MRDVITLSSFDFQEYIITKKQRILKLTILKNELVSYMFVVELVGVGAAPDLSEPKAFTIFLWNDVCRTFTFRRIFYKNSTTQYFFSTVIGTVDTFFSLLWSILDTSLLICPGMELIYSNSVQIK